MIKIGIDFDSVINNLTEAWMNKLNEISSFNYSLKDITSWKWGDIYTDLKPSQIYSKSIINKKFFDELDECQGAIDGMNKLLKIDNTHLYIVSASFPDTIPYKVKWIQKHLPAFNTKDIIFTFDKSIINVDMLIDDNLDNLLSGSYIRVVLDYPYNHQSPMTDLDTYIHRCFCWEDIVDFVKKYTEQINEGRTQRYIQ